MKHLINLMSALSLALYVVPPFAAHAQDYPTAMVGDYQVICLPDPALPCPDGAFCTILTGPETCQMDAEQAVANQAVADQAAADQAAADQAAADQAVADQAAADQAAADQAAADQAAADQAAADQAAADQAAADQAAAAASALQTAMVGDNQVMCLPDDQTPCPDGAVCVVLSSPDSCQADAEQAIAYDQTAAEAAFQDAQAIAEAEAAQQQAEAEAAADPSIVPVEAPVPEPEAVDTLVSVLANPEPTPDAPIAPAMQVAAADVADLTTAPEADAPPPAGVTVTTETVTTTVTRTSYQEFDTAPVRIGSDKKSHLSDLEKVGLVALGALVIGAMINDNRQQVVSNTGDRVVVRQYDGSYVVYKDDNALLREPGSTVTTQTFRDGSTRVIVERADGSQIATIRDASGRVLQRVAYDPTGRATILIDDMQPEIWVDVRDLPRPRPNRTTIELEDQNAALRAAMAAADIEDLGRKFSLRQIRTIPQVRDLAPTITMNTITFASGSAAVEPSEAARLNKLGKLITDLIAENPNEVFLIEGHTDAVGSAASNLALSDRRAESVAKALTEYFDVPPENLVVQGYGESELLVPTGSDERANRRVAVRIITALLQQTAR
jgi:outer membrane protein OmpA-like peptidoglycan-associated protein